MTPSVSIIIPTLNEQEALPDLVQSLALQSAAEVIVADGGSGDRTRGVVDLAGWRWVDAPRGRAAQMNAGARLAKGDVLLFLHADVTLQAGALAAIQQAVAAGAESGNLEIAFGGGDWVARTFDFIYRARLPFGILYGDSGIWVRRDVFQTLGGYRDWPIMEDYELARRLWRRGTMRFLRNKIYVSPRRWKNAGLLHALAVWVLIQTGYTLGVPPRRLAWMYRVVR